MRYIRDNSIRPTPGVAPTLVNLIDALISNLMTNADKGGPQLSQVKMMNIIRHEDFCEAGHLLMACELYRGDRQQDAQEFLSNLLDNIHIQNLKKK